MLIDYAETSPLDIYKLMSQSIVPRPIAWVVTESGGVVNVAPFSYFTALSSNPATMIVSVGHKSDGTPKDTLRNVRETRKCTLCIASVQQLDQMHFTSKELEAHVSEADRFDLSMLQFCDGYPPMIEGAPVAFACDFHSEVDLGGSRTIPLIVRIRHQYVDDGAVVDEERLVLDFDAVARIGKRYARIGESLTPPDIP